MESLPLLDYSCRDRSALSREITKVMGDLGFLYLENIPGYNEDELRWCVDFFFALPLEKRMEIARRNYCPKNKNQYRGYFGVNQCGSSFKEAFETGEDLPVGHTEIQTGYPLTENNVWPHPDKNDDIELFDKFKTTMEHYYTLFHQVALDLLRLISLGLGLSEHYFDCLYAHTNLSTLRLINYPVHNFEIPSDAYSPDDGKLLSTAAHRDSPTLTLLTTFDYEGLQIQMKDMSWFDVATRKNTVVVNLGETISRMSGRRVKATIHRVLSIGRPRQSVPFFLEPGYHSMLPHSLPTEAEMKVSAASHPVLDTFEYGPWLREYIMRFVEWQGFDND